MNCSTPGFPVHHQLPGACSNSSPSSGWCHPTISSSLVPFSSCPQSFPASGCFQFIQLIALDGQSIGVSASASVLPMNIQDWFPLGWTGLILQSKGLSWVFSNTTVQKHKKSDKNSIYKQNKTKKIKNRTYGMSLLLFRKITDCIISDVFFLLIYTL